MEMRPSRVLAKLRAGEVASCIKLNLSDPRAADIAAICGVDCIWNDMEHVPNTELAIENQIRAAKMHDVDTVVRVRRGSYSDIVLPLEMDAAGIMVPHVMSADDARKVVHQSRFHPLGRRAWDGGNSDGKYCMIDPQTYLTQANEQRFVIVQIEDPEPMDELEEIASIDGIDMLFFGPGDFSQGIGHPGEFNHPEVIEARKRVADVALANGKFAGTVSSPATLKSMVDMGYTFLNISADVVAMAVGFKAALAAFDEL